MNASLANPSSPSAGSRGAHIFLLLLLSLGVTLATNPLVGLLGFVAGTLLLARPFDPFLGALLVACVATFVNNEGGHLTRDLSVVTLVGLLPLTGWYVAAALGRWHLPRSALTLALIPFGLSIALSTARGVLGGNSLRYLGLELAPQMTLFLSLALGGLRLDASDRRLAFRALALTALVHVGIGFYSYVINRIRTGGIFFTPIPGIMALVTLNLLLYHRPGRLPVLTVLLIGLFVIQQLISFARGYWFALLAGALFSFVLYGRVGPGAVARWQRIGRLSAMVTALVAVGVLVISIVYGWGDVFSMIATRFLSTGGARWGTESASNFERLVEYAAAWPYLISSPWLGHGLGFEMRVRQPLYQVITRQWYIHQNYILIWMKQGLIGLFLFIGVLAAALRVSVRGTRRLEGEVAGWCAAAGAGTVYLAVLSLTNFPFAVVNTPAMLAVLWGIAISATSREHYVFRWGRVQAAGPEPSERAA